MDSCVISADLSDKVRLGWVSSVSLSEAIRSLGREESRTVEQFKYVSSTWRRCSAIQLPYHTSPAQRGRKKKNNLDLVPPEL